MRTLFDSIDVARLPVDAQMVAGYVGGHWPTYGQLASRFPHAIRVSIAVNASEDAQVLDVETGDATPGQAPAWTARQRTWGRDPTVYCNTSTWPDVETAFRSARVPLAHWWRADYDGRAVLEMGEVAHQYRSDTATDLDWSVVADFWPGVDSGRPPSPQEDPHMSIFDGGHASDDDRDGAVREMYLAVFGSEPTVAQLNFCKWCLGAGAGYGAMVRGLADSAAGQTARAKRSPQPTG